MVWRPGIGRLSVDRCRRALTTVVEASHRMLELCHGRDVTSQYTCSERASRCCGMSSSQVCWSQISPAATTTFRSGSLCSQSHLTARSRSEVMDSLPCQGGGDGQTNGGTQTTKFTMQPSAAPRSHFWFCLATLAICTELSSSRGHSARFSASGQS
jgi:hypothetical protein